MDTVGCAPFRERLLGSQSGSHLLQRAFSSSVPQRSQVVRAASQVVVSGRELTVGERIVPCTKRPFYGDVSYILTGTSFFTDIEDAALADDETKLARWKQSIAAGPAEVRDCVRENWEAEYTSIDNSTIQIHAAHLAASLGSVSVMAWLCDVFGADCLDRQAVIRMGQREQNHYTPLMSALFMSKTKAAIWLLNRGARATIPNVDGLTPCHLLAEYGLTRERADSRLKSLGLLLAKLVERSADLSALSGPMLSRSDSTAERIRNRTPLEIGVGMRSSFPKQALHLLTTSFHNPARGALFQEVSIVAGVNPYAAEVLLEAMRSLDIGEVRKRLAEEVSQLVAKGEHMDKFLQTLRMSPVAGVQLLELLMMEPHVKEPHRHPLPLYTYLADGFMLPAYQPPTSDGGFPEWARTNLVECGKGHGYVDDGRPRIACGDCGSAGAVACCRGACHCSLCRRCLIKKASEGPRDNKTPPKWHMQFAETLPQDPMLYSTVHAVLVRVLHLPGVINLRLLGILSRVPAETHYNSIFSEVSVNSITRCIWSNCVPMYWFTMAEELLLLCVLLVMGVEPPAIEHQVVQNALRAVVLAHLLLAVLKVAWGVATCEALVDLSPRRFVPLFLMCDIVSGFFLCCVLHLPAPVHTGFDKVLVTVNVLVRCSLLILKCRSVLTIGPTIMSVQKAFSQMIGMFALISIVFVSFFFCFVIFKDTDRTIYFVFVYLFQALVLADRDTAEAISGLDMAGEQKLDFHQELFTGHDGDEWILQCSLWVTILSSSLFSLVLLNLMIGIYTKSYEQIEPVAAYLFQQVRTKQCTTFMLQPAWQSALRIRRTPQLSSRLIRMSIGTASLGCVVLFVLSLWGEAHVFVSAVLLFLCAMLSEVLLVYPVADIGERDHYLWVSYRADFKEAFGMRDNSDEMHRLRQELEGIRVALDGLERTIRKD